MWSMEGSARMEEMRWVHIHFIGESCVAVRLDDAVH